MDVGCCGSLLILLHGCSGEVDVGGAVLRLVLLLSRRALLPGSWVQVLV